ncbi:MAG: hypothetical protein WDN06_05855 [Asticcacaulis sp.]
MNASGFVSDIELTGRDLEVNYVPGSQRSPNILRLHRDPSGQWRGDMMDPAGQQDPGHAQPGQRQQLRLFRRSFADEAVGGQPAGGGIVGQD